MAGSFLKSAGTNGLIGTKRAVTWTTALNNLASGSRAISDAAADTGLFTQASFSNAQYGMAYFTNVGSTWATTAGGVLACWWLQSYDAGTNFEVESRTTPSTSVPALMRPPDFIIPVYSGATALAAGDVAFAEGLIPLPYVHAKLVVQNLGGAALSANAHTLNIFGVGDGYT
jgi:hypothetical protein